MIKSSEDLARSNAALGDLYAALAALRRDYERANPSTFALIAEGPLHEIQRIQHEIDEYVGATSTVVQRVSLWMRLAGSKAQWGETPTSVVTAFLDSFRKGVQAIAGSKLSGRSIGRPSNELQLACDFELASFAPGSFQVALRLPEPEQGSLFPIEFGTAAAAALRDFVDVTAWAAQPYPKLEELRDRLPDARSRRVALRAVKLFVPRRHGGVDFVELYGPAVKSGERIHLAVTSMEAISQALADAVDEVDLMFEGEIREMDLDKRAFKLRGVKDAGEIACRFSDDLHETAAELLGRRVRVIGTRKATNEGGMGALQVTDIEKLSRNLADSRD